MESSDGLAVPGVRELKTMEDIVKWLRDCMTPLDMVELREGRAGETYHYLRHQYVTETLNMVTGHHWSNEVLREFEQENDVACLVRLTAHLPVGRKEEIGEDENIYIIDQTIEVVHEAWGGATLNRYRDGDKKGLMIPGAVADAYNIATSKGLTKAATRLGLGLDLGIPIRPATLKRLNTVGSSIFDKKDDELMSWDDVRPKLVRVACHGRSVYRDGQKFPVTSSRDLREIEARILVGALSKDSAPLCQSLAMSLRPIAAAALQK